MKKVYILLGVLVLLVLLYVGYVAASKSRMKPKKGAGCQGTACQQAYDKSLTCPKGGCDQRGSTNDKCDGIGGCDQKYSQNPYCAGGKCDQRYSRNATCGGGKCDQRYSLNTSCAGGGCRTDGAPPWHDVY
jgi:hypothetical protein